GFVADKIPEEPTLSPNTVTPEDLEALAESGTSDDKLMAEFQKVLGENKS
ncbi:MAG: hypothetical protein JST16_15690, partial [Bdellovibrionales bacterium]|nr:hypothetical protein [Bdellovibrionales bacterium]